MGDNRSMDKQKVLNQLAEFISIQSVSSDLSRFSQIEKAVDFLKRKFLVLGFKVKIFKKPKTPPLILAIYNLSRGRDQDCSKTIGIYGHYDVQPEEPVDQWKTSPFKLMVRNGKFFGRGVADNKGHIIQNLTSINRLIKEKKLKNNIVFILEGEEEVGSVHFEELANQAREILGKVDVFYLTDAGMHRKNFPQIFYGLRGIVYFQLTIKIGESDLHSGLYGNRVYNPINLIGSLIAKIKDVNTGKINIPGFYKNLRKPGKEELEILKKTLKSDKEERKEAKVFGLTQIENYGSLSSKIFPSFDCHGIISGYVEEGQKTIIPSSALVKFSFRLVEYQNPEQIERLVFDFVAKNLPKDVKWELKCLSKSSPFYTDVKNEYIKKTAKALKKVFGHKPLFNRSGGSIPAAEILSRLFKKPIILTGFTLPDDNIHAPNENFDEEMFWQGIEALKEIYY